MNLKNIKILDGSILKLIAIVTMLFDHLALILLSNQDFATDPLLAIGSKQISLYFILRKIGRFAFPIFCFLITQGFIHTKNIKKYIFNLLLFAIISEVPFDLMVGGKFIYLSKQNIYFTLLLGILALWVIDNINIIFQKYLLLALIITVAIILKVDYGQTGVMLIILIYVLRDKPAVQAILALPFLSGGYAALCSFIPINMYNGKRGFIKGRTIKYLFYVFYPLHIIILLLIKIIL
ncbi:MAG: TraX protein [Clostridia bacterium]|nr:TraX protein [Clostridia bacterium]